MYIATDVGMHGLLVSQSCYHSVLCTPCLCTLRASSRFRHPYILLISLEIFSFLVCILFSYFCKILIELEKMVCGTPC